MIKNIIDLLNLDDFYGAGEEISFAKGKYKYPTTMKEGKELLKRIWKSK